MFKRFLLILLLIPSILLAQNTRSSSVKQAQKAYDQAINHINNNETESSVREFKKAIELDPNFFAAYQQLGDLLRKGENYSEAISNYKRIIESEPNFYPLTYFYLAESEINIGDYENALQHFEKYLKFTDISQTSKEKAEKYILDCQFSLLGIKNPVPFKPINMGSKINSNEDEYLPAITADEETIIFTRQANRNEDFFTSKKINQEWTNAIDLSRNINTVMYNEGAQNISPDGKYLFFTSCNRPDGLGRCDIYISKKEGNTWTEPFNIGEPINSPGWESQPSISADGRTLFFVSTRKGGYGGYDIWSSELASDGSWSEPKNLGPNINTKYDETSPFIHPDDESLYFSSNGWPGYGNKDLFLSKKTKNQENQSAWSIPQNLGYPINTHNEESGLFISHNQKKAFFSAKKDDGFGKLDIYYFDLPDKYKPKDVSYVKANVFDKTSLEKLNAQIQIIDLKTKSLVFDDISEEGTFLASLQNGKNYGLIAKKEGYLFYSHNFALNNTKNNEAFHIDIDLEKIGIEKVLVLNNIFFDSNKYELLPDSELELNELILFLNDNPKLNIEIGGHTDSVGEDEFNLTLSKNRAKTVFEYLVKNNVSASRLTYKGFGKSKPISDNNTEEGRKKNRRTEIKIIK